jgi:hypothetical protein
VSRDRIGGSGSGKYTCASCIRSKLHIIRIYPLLDYNIADAQARGWYRCRLYSLKVVIEMNTVKEWLQEHNNPISMRK